jgi:ribonuclease BN (tRNA processing enzyme)
MIRTGIGVLAVAGLVALVSVAAVRSGASHQTPPGQQKSGAPVAAAATSTPELSWITLGTQGGPIPSGERSEPANLLVVDGQPWIVDCGDGAMDRLAAAGFKPAQVDIAFISHLHVDHIGGLSALIGLRWFTGTKDVLTIYGPPGTDVLVKGIVQSLTPTVRIGLGVGPSGPTPEQLTRVVIVQDGSDLNVNGVHVRAVRNSHFDDSGAQSHDNGSQSLSYRYDYKGYGIGYTGDTGPSDTVARLEQGADLLVSEVIDLPAMTAFIRQVPDAVQPPQAKSAIIHHFETQHLTPEEAGAIAARAGVRRLVFTHLSIPGSTNAEAPKLVGEAHETFKGEVAVAHDLDRF